MIKGEFHTETAVATAFLKKMEPKLNVPRLNKCNNPIILHILRRLL